MGAHQRKRLSVAVSLVALGVLVISLVIPASALLQDATRGAAGYLPTFHPTPLTAAEATTARTNVYAKTPDPANLVLGSPSYTAKLACLGRGFDPRGPFAEPPQAPYLLPGNLSAITFGQAVVPGGGLYIAIAGNRFSNVATGTPNVNPTTGPIVTPENTAGIYEVALGADGTCSALRTVSGGPTGAGSNAGPHPEFGDFGASITALSWHNGLLYANDSTGGTAGAVPGSNFSGGRIHAVDPVTGSRTALIANLPSEGDYQNGGDAFFSVAGQEWLEFGQGTTTNSGTVDGEALGDIPCFDVKLTSAGTRFYPFTIGYHRNEMNLPSSNPLVAPQANGDIVVHGTLPCNGSTMAIQLGASIQADGTNLTLRLTGFGFHNPAGLGIAPGRIDGIGGELLVSDGGVEVRGQRPFDSAADQLVPSDVSGTSERNHGWPNATGFSSSSSTQFGLGNNELSGDAGVFTGNQARRSPTQPAQPLVGQGPIFTYIGEDTGALQRGGQPLPAGESADSAYVPGMALTVVGNRVGGLDFSTNPQFGFSDSIFVPGMGDPEFPLGSAPQHLIGRDIRRYQVLTTSDHRYLGTSPSVFAANKAEPGGWPNLNTGGLLGPIDVKFGSGGQTMFVADFGEVMTLDTGTVGGFRCELPGDCANGAKQFPGSGVTQAQYVPTVEQVAGSDLIWSFVNSS